MLEEYPTLIALLKNAVSLNASDIHLTVGSKPAFRLQNGLLDQDYPVLSAEDLEKWTSFFNKAKVKTLLSSDPREKDGSFAVEGLARFRFNLFTAQGRKTAVIRIVPLKVPTLKDLEMPTVFEKLCNGERGLILITGATGSGKSTTLAAMVDNINTTQDSHVLTVEDPIEFVHTSKKSRITQREVGWDTESFVSALRSALRQDPDVILVGEMRDRETMDVALKAAETGHLVLSTVHTPDVKKTIGRLLSMFPAEEQLEVRQRLADNLSAVISQRLVERKDGKGRVPALEIMVNSTGIQECITDPARHSEIYDFIIKEGSLVGSQTFDQHLSRMFVNGVISRQTALKHASNPSDFERSLMLDEASAAKPEKKIESSGEAPVELDTKAETQSSPLGASPTKPQDSNLISFMDRAKKRSG